MEDVLNSKRPVDRCHTTRKHQLVILVSRRTGDGFGKSESLSLFGSERRPLDQTHSDTQAVQSPLQ